MIATKVPVAWLRRVCQKMAFSGNPSYYLNVIDEPAFWKVMILALVLQIIGMIIMRRLINFKV